MAGSSGEGGETDSHGPGTSESRITVKKLNMRYNVLPPLRLVE